MSRALRTRSYQAVLAQDMGAKRIPHKGNLQPQSNNSISLPYNQNPMATTNPPISMPLVCSTRTAIAINTPSLDLVLSKSSTVVSPPTSSQMSLSLAFNIHINPFIFDTPSTVHSASSFGASTPALIVKINTDVDNDLDLAQFENTPTLVASHPAPTPKVAPLLMFLPDEERTFDVYFNIWQAQVGDVAPPKAYASLVLICSKADGVPGVNKVNPPMSRSGFCWIKAANYEKAKNKLLGFTPAGHPLRKRFHWNYHSPQLLWHILPFWTPTLSCHGSVHFPPA
ncbi:hypothetical protein DFH28DRAFT_1119381 [Melampsora americana]|nr:hypothetical protein DFH28DRAFT_1119381 [Melampsora americana]